MRREEKEFWNKVDRLAEMLENEPEDDDLTDCPEMDEIAESLENE